MALAVMAAPVAASPVTVAALAAAPSFWSGLLIGASMALLVFAAIGNLLLALATGRRAFAFYAIWAALVPIWGVFETELIMLILPGAGTAWTHGVASFIVMLAIVAAALGLADAVRSELPRWLDRAIAATCLLLVGAGAFNMALDGSLAAPHGITIEIVALVAVALGILTCALAWRHDAAREFAVSFSIPTLAMVGTFDLAPLPRFPAGSADYVVLGACALQTLCLMLIAARRLLRSRRERDAALDDRHRMAALAESDPLTGLLNRRGFVARAEAMLGSAEGATLALFDIDRFKTVNDNHGHDAGDRLLRAIADALRRAAPDAVFGRLGGEEFAVAARPGDDPRDFADRLRAAIAAVRLADGPSEVAVSASAGVSTAAAGRDFLSVYRAADRALMAAKHAGRDRTCVDDAADGTIVAP